MTARSYPSLIREAKADLGPVCLVVGGAGFLGQALTGALLERGHRVRVLDRTPLPAGGRAEQHLADIRDLEAVREATSGVSTVFHTAAVINLLGVYDRATRAEVFGINCDGTRNVIRACVDAGVPRLVYTSTNSVCFDPDPVVNGDESTPYAKRFIDLYAESKVEAERDVLAADGVRGLRTVALRPAGLWGPGPGCYMLQKFVEELARGSLVATIGDGRAVSDNTHVANLVHAELLAAEKLVETPDAIGGRAYFITDEEQLNLMEWFRPLLEGLGYSMPRWSIPARLMYGVAYLMEWAHRLGGPRPKMTRLEVHNLTSSFTFRTDRARRELNYAPLIQREEGQRICLPYYREVLRAALARGGRAASARKARGATQP